MTEKMFDKDKYAEERKKFYKLRLRFFQTLQNNVLEPNENEKWSQDEDSIKEFIRKHGPVNLDAGKPFFNETIIKKISRYENFIIFKTDFSVPSFTGNIFSYKRFCKDITKPAIYNPKADLGVPNHIMLPTSKAPYLEPIDIANIQKGNTKLIF